MRLASLGSGSSGNASLVCAGDAKLIVDCGFTVKETERRMKRLGVAPSDLNAILVTHEHSDHIKGVGALARKYSLPIYMTRGTYVSRNYGALPEIKIIEDYCPFEIKGVEINPVAVPHDAREPSQFTFRYDGLKLGILTDVGSITPHMLDAYSGCDTLLVEANHDLNMLANGPYPPALRARVASNWGHLNNVQTVEFLQKIESDNLKSVVIGHISRKNNSVDVAKEALDCVADRFECMHYACQDDGIDWLSVEK